ncbi:MAG: GNAT family N-acetyltransferase [Spirochaetia bacterium]
MLVFLDTTDCLTAEAVLNVQKKAFVREAEIIGKEQTLQLKETTGDLQEKSAVFTGFMKNRKLLGCISWVIKKAELDIHTLTVLPENHRQGIASILLDFAENQPEIQSVTVQAPALNHPALCCYTSRGYVQTKTTNTPERIQLARFTKDIHHPQENSFNALSSRYPWKPIYGCPGRYIFKNGTTAVPPEQIAGKNVASAVFPEAQDRVFFCSILGGGLISYQKEDNTFLHTLCSIQGYKKKLKKLGTQQSE